MAKKGIAIPYIIALILGIVVVGVIGYWFFTTTGTGSGSAAVASCNTKKLQWCSEYSKTGFASVPIALGDWGIAFAPGCKDLGIIQPTERECRSLTGTLLGIGAACTDGQACQSGSCARDKCVASTPDTPS